MHLQFLIHQHQPRTDGILHGIHVVETGAIVNLATPSSDGFTMRASMFAYLDPFGNSTPTDPCFDSSPIFNESPKTIICTGYPFHIHTMPQIKKMDSLVYSWDEPLDDFFGAYNPPVTPGLLTYTPPYTSNNPLPGNPIILKTVRYLTLTFLEIL